MRVSVGSDHRGVPLKTRVAQWLAAAGHEVVDRGTDNLDSVDYPDIASAVGQDLSDSTAERGILICGTGIGMAITANKIPGVRATTCHDEFTAEMCRRHNDVNVLCLAGDLIGERPIDQILRIWLETQFEGGRHARRLQKIADLERG